MPTKQESTDAIRKLADAQLRKQVITFDQGLPDRANKEVLWSLYGLIETNEIVVIARYRDLEFGLAGPSPLIHPGMIDRIFGMDVDDRSFAGSLADALWPMIEEATRA